MQRVLVWKTPRRYYAARLHQDLLGDWVLECAWGGRKNQLGARTVEYVGSEAAGNEAIATLHQRRIAHRYQLVSDTRH